MSYKKANKKKIKLSCGERALAFQKCSVALCYDSLCQGALGSHPPCKVTVPQNVLALRS